MNRLSVLVLVTSDSHYSQCTVTLPLDFRHLFDVLHSDL